MSRLDVNFKKKKIKDYSFESIQKIKNRMHILLGLNVLILFAIAVLLVVHYIEVDIHMKRNLANNTPQATVSDTTLLHPKHHPDYIASDDTLSLHKHIDRFMEQKEINGSTKVAGYYGIDVSHYQGHINWTELHNDTFPEKLKFYIIKATEGYKVVDSKFDYNWENAKSPNTARGAYHFYHYKQDPIQQAHNYIHTVNLKPGEFRPIIDIELDCAGCTKPGVSKQKLVKDLKTFLATIEKHYDTKPILYTYTYFYKEYLQADFEDYTFWIARYSSHPPNGMIVKPQDSAKPVTKPKIAMWQFTSKERFNGINGNVDASFMPSQYLEELVYR